MISNSSIIPVIIIQNFPLLKNEFGVWLDWLAINRLLRKSATITNVAINNVGIRMFIIVFK